MKYIDIKDKLNNKISFGKEVDCFELNNKIIKIFKETRQSPLKKMSDEGLEKLSKLNLKHFNLPKEYIYDENNNIVGYVEDKLQIENYNTKFDQNYFLENLDELKDDIRILSDNGYKLEDIMYNYTFNNGNIIFFDLTSYEYINVKNDFLKEYIYKNNIKMINTFLVGLTMFDAFKHGEKNELKKIYLSNKYIIENSISDYFGDYIKNNDTNKKSFN